MIILKHKIQNQVKRSFSANQHRSWWHQLWGETRTRIMLLYVVVMLLIGTASVPVFLVMLFANVEERVEENMAKELQEFNNAYSQWEGSVSFSDAELRQFLKTYVEQRLPEDDNFLVVILDNQLLVSNPVALPPILEPDSPLAQRWMSIGHGVAGRVETSNDNISNILYSAQPIIFERRIRGSFVIVHQVAGEQQEALEVVGIFAQVALGVVIVSSVVTWLATAHLLTPVRQLVSAARSVNESDLSQRIPPMQGAGEMAELAETFNNMMGRLQDAFTSQRNFINDAGHELRTPLTIIQGHLELLGDDPQERQETMELVMDELDRMSRLINDLILLTKAERPDFLNLERIDIFTFTEEVFAKSHTLAERGWQLQNHGKGWLIGDRQRLTGAMLNLVQNAIHHTHPTQVIEIGSAATDQQVRFWVRDTGEGIAPLDQKRIFERFARAKNRYRRSEGAGLGLAIVRAIVDAHGGQVELTSQVGKGSTFTLVLPLEATKGRLLE